MSQPSRADHRQVNSPGSARIRESFDGGFTLVELLVVLALVGILAAFLVGAMRSAQKGTESAQCAQRMRQLGTAILAWSNDNAQRWPRSNHSAFAHRERGWMRAVLPYFGLDENIPNAQFRRAQEKYFRCPADRARTTGSSYGLNVYFELEPGVDDYEGTPAQWRTRPALVAPSQTILLAEVAGAADHVMAHFWMEGGTGFDVAPARHGTGSNYLFADGSLRALALKDVFDPARGVNLWHPEKAARSPSGTNP